MKKKMVTVVLCAALSLTLSACSGGSESTSESSSGALSTSTIAPTQEEEEPQKEEKDGFDESTNETVTFWGFEIPVPSYWEEVSKELSTYTYSAESGDKVAMLQFQCTSSNLSNYGELKSGINELMDSFGNGVENYSHGDAEEIDFCDSKAMKFDYFGNMSGFDVSASAVLTMVDESSGNVFLFTLVQSDGTEYSYMDDFEKIMEAAERKSSDDAEDPGEPNETSESTPTPEPTPTIASYGGGTLKVGTDMPEGEYIALSTSDYGGYFSVNSDANGTDIIYNSNFEYCSILTVYNGEYLELSRARVYPFDQWCAQNSIDLSRAGGMYKVGVTLPAGEYLLTATSEFGGYYCIYPDSRQQEIIANNNFEGQTYVNVTDGQYLTLTRCVISQ